MDSKLAEQHMELGRNHQAGGILDQGDQENLVPSLGERPQLRLPLAQASRNGHHLPNECRICAGSRITELAATPFVHRLEL